MKIEVGMKCKQIKVIEMYGFNCIGMEFKITKVNDDVIMCKGNGIGFGIEPNEFENYFEVIKEEIKEKENNIMNLNTNNQKGKKVRIINTEGFIRDDYKDLEKYINQTGIVRWDFESNGHRLSIKFDDEVMDNINESNGRLCFRIDSVEFIDNTCEKPKEKDNKTLDINNIKIGQKYRVIENRDTCYGRCKDLKEIEGQEVEIMGLNVEIVGDIRIKSKNNIHICRVENLEEIKKEKLQETKQVELKPTNKVYNYNMIPHKINWIITHNGETINQTIDSGNESYKLIINGNTTIVILDDGCKGVAKCMETDEYDMDKGVDIAYTKAIIKSSQKKLKMLVK